MAPRRLAGIGGTTYSATQLPTDGRRALMTLATGGRALANGRLEHEPVGLQAEQDLSERLVRRRTERLDSQRLGCCRRVIPCHRTRSVVLRIRPAVLVHEGADGVADRLLVQQRQPGRPLGVVVAQGSHDALVLTL
jgi:hypothetical protein